MEDLPRAIGTFDNRNTAKINMFGSITNFGSTYRFADADNVWNTATAKAGVDAHYGAARSTTTSSTSTAATASTARAAPAR